MCPLQSAGAPGGEGGWEERTAAGEGWVPGQEGRGGEPTAGSLQPGQERVGGRMRGGREETIGEEKRTAEEGTKRGTEEEEIALKKT